MQMLTVLYDMANSSSKDSLKVITPLAVVVSKYTIGKYTIINI